jgi:hypothetical protein
MNEEHLIVAFLEQQLPPDLSTPLIRILKLLHRISKGNPCAYTMRTPLPPKMIPQSASSQDLEVGRQRLLPARSKY